MAERLEIIIAAKDRATSTFRSIGSSLGKLSTIAGVGVVAGLGATAAGLGVAVSKGLAFNNTLEQTTAQLNAFTKDGAKTAQILDMIRDRAAKTPFAFQEMATSAASLIPAANQSGKSLEELISLAEILAASNPAQGLEGAAFSLREALSGDFVSIVERFNLPRQRLKELKDAGVPALEAISTAMGELGLDAELVTNLSQTATGRLSTFKDTLVTLAATATEPIFNVFSEGLGTVNQWLTDNQPLLEGFAKAIASNLAEAFYRLSDAAQVASGIISGDTTAALTGLLNIGFSPDQALAITDTINEISSGIGSLRDSIAGFTEGAAPIFEQFWIRMSEVLPQVQAVLSDAFSRIGEALGQIGEAFGLEGGNIFTMENALLALQGTLEAVVIGIQGFALVMQGVATGIEGIADAVDFVIGKLGELNDFLGGFGSQGGILDSLVGFGATGGGPTSGGGSTNIMVNPTPVTLTLNGQKVAESTSGYQGATYTNYAALGGIGAQ